MSQFRNLLFKTFEPGIEILGSVYFTQGTVVDTGVVLARDFSLDTRFSCDSTFTSNYYFCGAGTNPTNSNRFFIQIRPESELYYMILGNVIVAPSNLGPLTNKVTFHVADGDQTIVTSDGEANFTRSYGTNLGTSTNSLVIGGFNRDSGYTTDPRQFAGEFEYLDINTAGERYHFVGAKLSDSTIVIYDVEHDVVIYPAYGELQEI